MPKIQRVRTKLHAPAVGSLHATPAAPSAEELRQRNAIQVLDEDVEGLDLVTALGETEEQKRAAVAAALKDLIAMGSDSDEDEDEEEDEEDEEEDDAAEEDAAMDGRMPSKGQLQLGSASAAAGGKPAAAAKPAKPALVFAPSAPAAPVLGKGASKADKRAAKHSKLMSRLALPGTLVAAVRAEKKAKKHADAAAFHSLRKLGDQLATPLLTPREQRSLNLQLKAATSAAAGTGAAASSKLRSTEGLFLGDEDDAAKLRQLEAQVQQRQMAAAPKKQKAAAAPAAAATPAAPTAAAPVVAAAPPPRQPHQPNQSAASRARANRAELAHFTAVLSHPRFQASPLAALQTHLANSQALQKLQQQVDELEQPDVAAAAAAQQAAARRSNVSGSTKKKNKKAAQHRQHVLQQQMGDD
jgi:hypothetical protein